MATIVTNSAHYYAIASAIREKLGTDNLFKPSEMAPAIRSISYYQKSINTVSLNASSNGTYRAPSVGNAFDNIVVDVDTSVPLYYLSVSKNGEYYPLSSGLFSHISVDVPIVSLSASNTSISENGTYYPPDGYAYTYAMVIVSQYSMLSLEVHRDGHYPIPESQAGRYLYDSVVVDVPEVDRTDFYSVFNRQVSIISNSEITNLRDYAFYNTGTVYSVDFPNVTNIGSNAFFSCRNLQHVDVPNLKTIRENAFLNCSYLRSLSLPACSFISSGAFQSCYRLVSLYLLSTTVVNIQNFSDVFNSSPFKGYMANATTEARVYVPSSLLNSYKTHSQWGNISSNIVVYSG